MYRITLEWDEGSQIRTRTISEDDRTLTPNTIRIGRGDETQCDIVLKNPDPQIAKTVSKTHIDIFFDAKKPGFFLRNLTRERLLPQQNPVIINGQKILTQEVQLKKGMQITLGKVILKIKSLEFTPSESQYIVKCSGPDQHSLEPQYEGLNCPYCGYIVFTGTILKM